ncbi:MAG: family 78 glycoside hydrolase catalytic domain, partial [Planctomycetota bacterium]
SWIVVSDERGQKQTAWQVLVASSAELLAQDRGDLWDSGKVETDETVNIAYAGRDLASRQECYWKVRVWDLHGEPSAWSESARWTMGLLKPEDWTARYISFRDETSVHKDPETLFLPPARQYRKAFRAVKPVRRATIYATALGIYELHLNGNRVGDAYFAPGWTDYHQRAYYQTYDVTSQVAEGENALGAWVADGWYAGYVGFGLLTGVGTESVGRAMYGKTPAVMAQLEIEYADGTRDTVVTDSSWKVYSEGPIREADFLMGEFYDARLETPGWSKAGYDDSAWQRAILAEENGSVPATFIEFTNPAQGNKPEKGPRAVDLGFRRPPKLEAFPGVPVRAIEELKPVAITSPESGVYIFNMGQNFAGLARLRVKGPAGTKVRLRFGEMLHPDGRLMTENLRKARAHDYYVLRGDAEGETYLPRFTFHGFQYVEVTGYPGEPGLDAITGVVLHSDTPLASTFECSDPMVNRLFKNIVWTQRANFVDLPTDCPQRDERMGWTGDAQAYIRSATYNADTAAFYTKWLRELMESQRPSGTFPGYAPFPYQHGWDFGTAWADAGVICPWTVYMVYGDTRVIDRCWEPMTRFMEWRKRTSEGYLGIVHGNNWGDWLAQEKTPTPLDYIDTVYFAYDARLMAEMAEATGRTKEAAEYRQLFQNIKGAFAEKYLRDDGSLAVDTQTAYALALFADLIPEKLRKASGERLAAKIRANDHRMATGFLGTRPLLPVLTSVGEHDLAVRLLQSRKFPSWGYEIEQGATTIWERWDSYTKEEGFGRHNAAMNSFSHYAFGAVCEWMFSTLAGIDTDGTAFKQILIRPSPPEPDSNPDHEAIRWVKASYDSIRGPIAVDWKLENGHFDLQVTIPANTSAKVVLPTGDSSSITESGKPLAKAREVRMVDAEGGEAVLSIGSGTYRFRSAL